MSTSKPRSPLSISIRSTSLNDDWRQQALARQQQLTKPQGSLGLLEELAIQLVSVQQTHQPNVSQARALIFAADHPVARRGTSAFPVEVTAAMVGNFLSGGAASSVLARSHDIPLTVIDMGVDTPYPSPDVSSDRYRKYDFEGGDIYIEAALTPEDFCEVLLVGRQSVARLPEDLNLLILGEMGIGNTTASAAVAGAVIGGEVESLVGRGTGIDDEILRTKTQIVSQAIDRWSKIECPAEDKVAEIMRQLGGREMTAVLGAMLEAVHRGVAILVDGFIISVVALVLVKLYPESRDYLIFSHQSHEAGHQKVLAELDATPLLSLHLRLGEASGALTAYPLLKAACDLHNQMATFEEAAVPNKDDIL